MPLEKTVRIPFDSFTLGAVVHELRGFVGGKIQDVRQPNEYDLALSIYATGSEGVFFFSCHPEYARCHFITKRLANQSSPPQLCATLRARLDGGKLVAVDQIRSDRVLELTFESPLGVYLLVAELMGKHSNLIFMDERRRILSAAKWVGATKSSRPIQPNSRYELPPVMLPGSEVRRSPFLVKLLSASGREHPGPTSPVLSPGNGAYPMSVAPLGLPEFSRSSISIALEQHFALAIPQQAADALKSSLIGQLSRVVLSKEVALSDLQQAQEAGGKAAGWQRMGELILAYGPSQANGGSTLQAWDYDGSEVTIKLDPALDFRSNASLYFERAKKAKGRMGMVLDQIGRISNMRNEILVMMDKIRAESRLNELEQLRQDAIGKRWLNVQAIPSPNKEDRPYAGHRVRELHAPGGFTVLYGENAESNDYLTLRVAKPNDYWLHVRGDTSAHVIVVTQNHPEKVQAETLRFAAKIAVQNSRAKHAGYVSVDYTLKKYVRRPKGAAKGTALYTNEKTIHIETQ